MTAALSPDDTQRAVAARAAELAAQRGQNSHAAQTTAATAQAAARNAERGQ